MALSGEEIRRRLSAFAARWSVYEGSERAEAQAFLTKLFECYGQDRSAVAEFEKHQEGRFVDLIWPEVCVIEMKAPSEAGRLSKHRKQARDYWENAADPEKGIGAPRYMVLCAFREIEVWEPGQFPKQPRAVLNLVDLPDQYDALSFLAEQTPIFTGGREAVTREAVGNVVEAYHHLRERRAGELDELRDFLLQSVWAASAPCVTLRPSQRRPPAGPIRRRGHWARASRSSAPSCSALRSSSPGRAAWSVPSESCAVPGRPRSGTQQSSA